MLITGYILYTKGLSHKHTSKQDLIFFSGFHVLSVIVKLWDDYINKVVDLPSDLTVVKFLSTSFVSYSYAKINQSEHS